MRSSSPFDTAMVALLTATVDVTQRGHHNDSLEPSSFFSVSLLVTMLLRTARRVSGQSYARVPSV